MQPRRSTRIRPPPWPALVLSGLTAWIALLQVANAQPGSTAQSTPPPPASSGEDTKSRKLNYTAVAGCPDVQWLKAELTRHVTSPFHRSVQAIDLTVVSAPQGYVGRIDVRFNQAILNKLMGQPHTPATQPEAAKGSAQPAPPQSPTQPESVPTEGSTSPPTEQASATSAWSREFAGAVCEDIVSALVMSVSLYLDELNSMSQEARKERERDKLTSDYIALDTLSQDHSFIDDPSDKRLNPTFPTQGQKPGQQPEVTTWGLAPMMGLRLRTGITASADFASQFGLDVRGLGNRWAAARFGIAYSSSELLHRSSPLPQNVMDYQTWDYQWWAASGHACPYGIALAPWAHFLPCIATYLGNYQGGVNGQALEGAWLGFWELTSQIYVRKSSFVGQAILGFHGPIDPLVGRKGSQGLRTQGHGLVLGIGIGFMPDAWIFL